MSHEFQLIKSAIDTSVNFVKDMPDGGKLEARFVQRSPDYFIVYLSSHTGCNKSCRFCHLTASGQITMTPASVHDYMLQAGTVLSYYKALIDAGHPEAKKVHFNFMARGEPLSNPDFVDHTSIIFDMLDCMAKVFGLESHFKVSTIMPADFKGDLATMFRHPKSMLYYSIYSLDRFFRRRWLPKAKDPYDSLALLKEYQRETGSVIALHWAFIKGENDSRGSVDHIHTVVRGLNLKVKFNVVRYNPYDAKSEETEEVEIESLFQLLDPLTASGQTSRIVPRVGFDVKASCGMFVTN